MSWTNRTSYARADSGRYERIVSSCYCRKWMKPKIWLSQKLGHIYIYETERINTPGQKEVNELDYEFLEAERKVDAFFWRKILRRRVSLHMSSRGPNHDMRGEHVLKVEAELRTTGRTNGCARTDWRTNERMNYGWKSVCVRINEWRTNEWMMDDEWNRTYKYAGSQRS